MSELRTHAEEVAAQFSDHVDVDADEVEERLRNLVEEYRVPVDEARRSVTNHYLDEAGVERDQIRAGGSEHAQVGDIESDDEWVDLRVQVVDLWDAQSDAVAQVGLVGDESGTTRFVAFETSDVEPLEEGVSYALGNVVTDEYQGNYSVKLNRTTTVERLDEAVEVGDDADEVTGALVDVQSGSGLIKRCPEADCTRVLQNGRCSEHGQVDGEFDLRIKGVLDDGETVHEAIFDRETTAELTGVGLEEAKQKAKDALDTAVVGDEMREEILGRYYRVRGPTLGRYLLVDAFEELGGPSADDAERALVEARSV
jgi:Single-stranded DNA-binding replication protein A (RPA), large (70 kD) subunit and related ssDNA-binding proteins